MVVLVLIGSIAGPARSGDLPDCVAEWMDTSSEWREMQTAVEDSLQALRTTNRLLEGQLELMGERLQWEQEKQPTWLEQWAIPIGTAVIAGVGVWIGANAAR